MNDECECGAKCSPCDDCNQPECGCTCDGDLEMDAVTPFKPKAEEGLELFS